MWALYDYAAIAISWVSMCGAVPRVRLPRCRARDKDALKLERVQYRAACLIIRVCITTRVKHGPTPQCGLSWGCRAVIRQLKLSHRLRMADVPDLQARPPWYSVPVEVRLTELR